MEDVGRGWCKTVWGKRTQRQHRAAVAELRAVDLEKREAKEKDLGVRYSPFLDLEYYDPIAFCAIDTMHNLYMGTAKTFMKLLRDRNLLTDKNMMKIDERLQEFKQGLTDECVIENMKSNMGTLTAAEWRHWTLISSGYCLFDLIPQKYLDVWEHFVQACTLLSPACIQYGVLAKVNHHLKEFGKGIGGLFGPAAVTPNMHMQMHMTEVVQQYGPLYACWLFAFERYNGVLGDIQTNNKQIEVQIMRRFMETSLADTLEDKLSEEHAQHFANMLPSRKRVNLKVRDTMHIPQALHLRECEGLWSNCTGIVTHSTHTVTGFYPDDFQLLRETYRVMYPSHGALLEEKI